MGRVATGSVSELLTRWPSRCRHRRLSVDGVDGEILVVEETPTLLEGEWPHTRTVVIRFRDENEAKRWYESEQYQALAQHRFRASRSNVILAKGRN